MPLPRPPKPLEPHCSAIYDDKLYTFSKSAFYVVPLSANAVWKELDMNVGTDGAACVHAHRDTPEESLYVIGGTTSDPEQTPEKGFQAVQRYRFNEDKWENIQLPDAIAYNLTNHGAVFLEATQQILLFSGTRWPDTTTPSSMTFLINTAPPYTITSQPGERAFPLLAPNVMNWGEGGALVAGGDVNNRNIYTYDINNGWNTLGVQLENGLPPRGQAATALVEGSEGAKLMLTIDMSVVPTQYRQVQVQDSKFGKRAHYIPVLDTPISNWPKYDDTLAPKEKRNGFSLAQSQKYIVVSGGGTEDDPLCIFDVRDNKWMNATALMSSVDGTSSISDLEPSPSASSRPRTSNSTDLDNVAATSDGTSKLSTLQILFIILGAVLFLALLLFGCLIFLRKKTRAQKRRQSENPNDRMSFQDRGIASFMKETGGPIGGPGRNRGHDDAYSNNSLDKELGAPPAAMLAGGGGQKQRSSGWSKYFSGNSTNLINLPSRTYSHNGRDNENRASDAPSNATRFPYASGFSDRNVAPLSINKPSSSSPYNPNQNGSSNPHRRSDISLASSYGRGGADANSLYSDFGNGSIAEKPLWDGKPGAVMESPRGWGVLVNDSRASSVYPESANIVNPDDERSYPNGGRQGKGDDMSWLNLRQ